MLQKPFFAITLLFSTEIIFGIVSVIPAHASYISSDLTLQADATTTQLTISTTTLPAIATLPDSLIPEVLAVIPKTIPAIKSSEQSVVTAVKKVAVATTTQKTVTKEVTAPIPFFSQFKDITKPEWKKVGCGIASLAMLIEFYEPGKVTVDTLLQEGIDAGAYSNAGWTYAGLIGISKKYGLGGESFDRANLTMTSAFAELKKAVEDGPVMVSVHYTFNPNNPIPHLVVLNSIHDDTVYYNDPAEPKGGGSISIQTFQNSWKKRYIEFRPLS